jgi:hypothetical protein
MNTDPDRQSGQRRPFKVVSGIAVAVCLLVAALVERRRRATSAGASSSYETPSYSPTVHDHAADATVWPSAAAVDEPVWEDAGPPVASGWPDEAPEVEHAEPVSDAHVYDHHEIDDVDEIDEIVEPVEAPPAASHWFGSFAPTDPWQPPVEAPQAEAVHDADTDEYDVVAEAVESEHDSVIELPVADDAPAADVQVRRLPPPRLRRFMGTGATVLVLGLVLGAGILVSGATADSTSDPATVPDAVGTTVADAVLPDTTTTDTTDTTTTGATGATGPTGATGTTGPTGTDTTSTDTTTTDTTTTSTTDTTTTGTTTTPTDTTTTATTPVDPPPPPPAADPAASTPPPATPAVDPPAVTPPATSTPSVPPTSKLAPKAKPKAKPTHHAVTKPVTSTHEVTGGNEPAKSGAPVVTLASGADPIGSILARTTAIPAVDAALLPTPAQVSFYVQAAKPLSPLPTLVRVDHPTAVRLVSAGKRAHVGWTVLAAISRIESDFGKHPGLYAGRHLSTTPTGDGLGALAGYLSAHGAVPNPLTPAKSRKALTAYFGSTRKADRAIALAALYGALGPFGMQHGVRAETARLQKKVLRDKRVHLTVAGRGDVRHGRVDPRVLVTLEYLANSFHKVGVSDLVSGGSLFSKSGSVSAHLYGRAADVASLHGTSVRGHQGPGTMTEQAIRKLLLLPKSLRPRQVISLMDVDGPTGNHGSFALPDHYNRIQIDY